MKNIREVLEEFGRAGRDEESGECPYCPSTSEDCKKCPKMLKALAEIEGIVANEEEIDTVTFQVMLSKPEYMGLPDYYVKQIVKDVVHAMLKGRIV